MGGVWEKDQPSRDQYQSPRTDTRRPKYEGRTYVERTETRAVGVKCLIVEIGELLSDRVDVCHGFSVGGSGKSRARHHLVAAAALRMIRFSDRDAPLN